MEKPRSRRWWKAPAPLMAVSFGGAQERGLGCRVETRAIPVFAEARHRRRVLGKVESGTILRARRERSSFGWGAESGAGIGHEEMLPAVASSTCDARAHASRGLTATGLPVGREHCRN
jgi:hypothetical protein